MRLSAKDLLSLPHAHIRCPELLKGVTFTGVSTDSRSVAAGDLFIALRGENFDGHRFVHDALARGAKAAIVDAAWAEKDTVQSALFIVEDTIRTLGELAHLYRSKFSIPVIAVAGSNGKTTTKDMITAVLGRKYRVHSTHGNLNNHVGVPHTLFGLEKKHDIAVVEIGTNHPGELAMLCAMLAPTHGLVTTIGREHLEFFETVEGVAREESSLFTWLAGAERSLAFVNADDARVKAAAKPLKRRMSYGFASRGVQVRGKLLGCNETGCASLQFTGGTMAKPATVRLAVPGSHNAMNALAAATVGLAFKVPAGKIRQALEDFRPSSKRMEVINLRGIVIYNDAYNANPDSTLAALQTLASATVTGKKIAVLGDMRELGQAAPEQHAQIGREIARLKIDYLLTYGEMARHIHDAAGTGPFAVHYDQKNMLAEYLAELVTPGDAVLVKASRSMKMEDIVTFLTERLQSPVSMYA